MFGAGHENQSSGSFTEDGSARIGLPVRSNFVNFSVYDAGHLDALAATFPGARCRRFVLVTLGVKAQLATGTVPNFKFLQLPARKWAVDRR